MTCHWWRPSTTFPNSDTWSKCARTFRREVDHIRGRTIIVVPYADLNRRVTGECKPEGLLWEPRKC